MLAVLNMVISGVAIYVNSLVGRRHEAATARPRPHGEAS
jgi:hypothetical protein